MSGRRMLPGGDRLAELRGRGMTYQQIADEYHVTPGAVYLACRRAGLTRAVRCPSCGAGTVRAVFQVNVTYPTGTVPVPDSDGFVEAECDNPRCRDALVQEPGDGRLRRAALRRAPGPGDFPLVDVDDPELEQDWMRAVEAVIGGRP